MKILIILLGILHLLELSNGFQVNVKQICSSYNKFCEKCEDERVNCKHFYKSCGPVFKKTEHLKTVSKSRSPRLTMELSLCRQLQSHCRTCTRQLKTCGELRVQCSRFNFYKSLSKLSQKEVLNSASKISPKVPQNQTCQKVGDFCSTHNNCCGGLTCQRQHSDGNDDNHHRHQTSAEFVSQSEKRVPRQKQTSSPLVCVQALFSGETAGFDASKVVNEDHFDGALNKNDDGYGIKGHDQPSASFPSCQQMGEACSTSMGSSLFYSDRNLACCPGFKCIIDLESPKGSYCSMENGKNQAEELMAEIMEKMKISNSSRPEHFEN